MTNGGFTRRDITAWGIGAGLSAFALPATLAFAALPTPVTIKAGDIAPDFKLLDSDGNTRTLSDYKRKRIVLEWTNHECPYVGKHYATRNMQRLQAEAVVAGVIWFSIISSGHGKNGFVSPEQARALTESRGASPTAVLLDERGDVGRLYGAMTTPHMFVIDRDRTLAYMGAIDDKRSFRHETVEGATNYVRQALADLAAGRPVAKAYTAPYGCNIHY